MGRLLRPRRLVKTNRDTQSLASLAAARVPPVTTRPPLRRAAWLRIFVVGCSLPYDPSGWGSFMQWGDDTTLPSRALYQGRIMHPQRGMRVERGHEYSPRYLHGSLAVPGTII